METGHLCAIARQKRRFDDDVGIDPSLPTCSSRKPHNQSDRGRRRQCWYGTAGGRAKRVAILRPHRQKGRAPTGKRLRAFSCRQTRRARRLALPRVKFCARSLACASVRTLGQDDGEGAYKRPVTRHGGRDERLADGDAAESLIPAPCSSSA